METGPAGVTAAHEYEEERHPALLPRRVPEGYYGLPPVKHSHYEWTIGSGFFAAGIAASLDLLTSVLDLAGRGGERRLLRTARYVALAGSLASPLLYIKDLGTPSRWFNMLRIFRPTSLMSVGSWSLSVLGAFNGLAAFGQLLGDVGSKKTGPSVARLAGLLGLPSALAVVPYMGSELEETSTPFWASSTPLLPALFVVSNISNGLSVLELSGRDDRGPGTLARSITGLALALDISELLLLKRLEDRWVEAEEYGLHRVRQRLLYRTGAITVAKIAAIFLRGAALVRAGASKRLLPAASLATLVTGFFLPAVLLFAGNRSADRPADYFSFTTPRDRSAPAPLPGARSQAEERPGRRRPGKRRSFLAGWVAAGCAAVMLGAVIVLARRRSGGEEELPYEPVAA